jgi:hypothetical protein
LRVMWGTFRMKQANVQAQSLQEQESVATFLHVSAGLRRVCSRARVSTFTFARRRCGCCVVVVVGLGCMHSELLTAAPTHRTLAGALPFDGGDVLGQPTQHSMPRAVGRWALGVGRWALGVGRCNHPGGASSRCSTCSRQ